MSNENKTIETKLGLVTCGKDFKTLHIGMVSYEVKNAGTPWESRRTESATSGCAGNRHVSNKHRHDLSYATCPRCRAAYLGETGQPKAEVVNKGRGRQTQNGREISKGDFLTLAYGQGTQTAYVADTTDSKVMIYRLIGYTGKWTGPRPMDRTDGRILAKITPPVGTEVPATGFIAAR